MKGNAAQGRLSSGSPGSERREPSTTGRDGHLAFSKTMYPLLVGLKSFDEVKN